ncbi:MAG: GldG family protein [Clostridia bacterium]|nr:GldG family protein [Clostridia bacterium]
MKEKKERIKEDKKPNKFIEIIKKKWLINGSKTFLLIAIIVAIFIAINILMQKLELTPIDFSQEKLFTLTEESKERVKNINKDVNIYFIGYTDDDMTLDLAKQYKKVNEKIIAEAIDINNRPDLANKYGIESGTQGIIVECGEKSKVLTANDLVTYDTTTYETISIAEEKLTSSILNVTSDEIPKVYFLQGYSDYTLTTNMNYLNMYLENEVNEIVTLNILSEGKVPEDCKTLVITTPNKDFDDVATNAIKDYINQGGNILWLNSAITQAKEIPNINSILAIYGINPFEVGRIIETDASKMVSGAPNIIFPTIEYSTITKTQYNTNGVVLIDATKINVDEDKLEELKVQKTDLLTTSETSFFRTNYTISSVNQQEGEASGEFIVGAELEKTITEANEETGDSKKTSKIVVIGENIFASDYPLTQSSQYPIIAEVNNKDIVLNSIAYLVDREEDITGRKSTGTVTYTATELQDVIVKIIIFIVPIMIIILGIVVWQIRRRKK